MPVLTNVQLKRIAKFLKASCERIPDNSNPPGLGQWLNILSKELEYRDWNTASARNPAEPVLSTSQQHWASSLWSFLGVARVVIGNQPPTYLLSYSIDREVSRHDVATNLARKILSRVGPMPSNVQYKYSRPNALSNVKMASSWKHPQVECPVVITTAGEGVTIQLWWLRESYQLQENLPEWFGDFEPHYVQFDSEGDHQLGDYDDGQLNDSLTDVFLTQLTGKQPQRRACHFVLHAEFSTDEPVTLLVEEGNPIARPVTSISPATRDALKLAADAQNKAWGLSPLDCQEICARFICAELRRNEEDFYEFSGVYDD